LLTTIWRYSYCFDFDRTSFDNVIDKFESNLVKIKCLVFSFFSYDTLTTPHMRSLHMKFIFSTYQSGMNLLRFWYQNGVNIKNCCPIGQYIQISYIWLDSQIWMKGYMTWHKLLNVSGSQKKKEKKKRYNKHLILIELLWICQQQQKRQILLSHGKFPHSELCHIIFF
jgi:hypothetical protein